MASRLLRFSQFARHRLTWTDNDAPVSFGQCDFSPRFYPDSILFVKLEWLNHSRKNIHKPGCCLC
jgi:hypothetical protein